MMAVWKILGQVNRWKSPVLQNRQKIIITKAKQFLDLLAVQKNKIKYIHISIKCYRTDQINLCRHISRLRQTSPYVFKQHMVPSAISAPTCFWWVSAGMLSLPSEPPLVEVSSRRAAAFTMSHRTVCWPSLARAHLCPFMGFPKQPCLGSLPKHRTFFPSHKIRWQSSARVIPCATRPQHENRMFFPQCLHFIGFVVTSPRNHDV